MEKILVTGGTGLLGSHLLYELISNGRSVRALYRKQIPEAFIIKQFGYYSSNPEELFSSIEWVQGDLHDIFSIEESLIGITKVFHSGAIVSFSKSMKNEMFKTNIEGTANLVNACLEKKTEKLIHVSSIAAIGRNPHGIENNENTYWKPGRQNTSYSVSKAGAEREVWRGAEEGLNVIIVNPSIIIGPGDWQKGSSNIFSKVDSGLKYYSDGGTGFIDVRDVAKILLLLGDMEISSERFILSSENLSYKKLFEFISDELGKKKPYIKTGKLLGEIAWRIEILKSFITGSEPLITRETADAAHRRADFSNKKVRDLLNYNFITIENSVKETSRLFLNDINRSKI